MLEALAAVSLAGNILQFITFSCQLFGTASAVHQSTTGNTLSIEQLNGSTKSLRQCCDKLSGQQKVVQNHPSLLELAQNCHAAATRLLTATEALKREHTKSRWSSFKVALATTWDERQIRDMERALDTFRLQGVFLWVRLAVRSLVEGLRNRDSLVLLRHRLHEFPSDLDSFFRHMFDSLESIYQPRLSHMFQVALAAGEPLSLLAYWFVDQIDDDPDIALGPSAISLGTSEHFEIVEDMKYRINGRSKGLLEAPHISTYGYGSDLFHSLDTTRVDFLHRTVKDFILTAGLQSMLKQWQHPNFDADWTLCRVILSEFKIRTKEFSEKVNYLLEIFMVTASRTERNGQVPIKLLETCTVEMDRAVGDHAALMSGHRSPWEVLKCYSRLSALLKYEMYKTFAESARMKRPSQKEKLNCFETLLEVHATSNLEGSFDVQGLFESVVFLLPTNHPIKKDEIFQKSFKTYIGQINGQMALDRIVDLLRGDYETTRLPTSSLLVRSDTTLGKHHAAAKSSKVAPQNSGDKSIVCLPPALATEMRWYEGATPQVPVLPLHNHTSPGLPNAVSELSRTATHKCSNEALYKVGGGNAAPVRPKSSAPSTIPQIKVKEDQYTSVEAQAPNSKVSSQQGSKRERLKKLYRKLK